MGLKVIVWQESELLEWEGCSGSFTGTAAPRGLTKLTYPYLLSMGGDVLMGWLTHLLHSLHLHEHGTRSFMLGGCIKPP